MQIATIGLDLAKTIFQVHGVDGEGGVVIRRRLRRAEVAKFFAGLAPCLVGMEACAGAHFWARTIAELGHEVRLMPPAYVKPYVRRQKNDLADAAAICEAVTRPSMRFVPIKSEAQQAMLLIHRARDLLVRQRTSLINALRAHLAEFGVVMPKGAQHGRRLVTMLLTGETFGMPDSAVPVLLGLARRSQALEAETAELEREMRRRSTEDEGVQRLLKVPGVGPITATALAATIPDANAFRSAREFAAWLGLVPRQSSSGGRERLGGITKMGPCLSAPTAGSRRPGGAQASRPRTGPRDAMAQQALAREATQGRGGGPGQQDGTHRLGSLGPRRSVPARRMTHRVLR